MLINVSVMQVVNGRDSTLRAVKYKIRVLSPLLFKREEFSIEEETCIETTINNVTKDTK